MSEQSTIEMASDNPKLILLFSGKRKSGKDFLTDILHKMIGPNDSEIVRISAPIKKFWAKEKKLNLNELLSDGPYKEIYRKEMIGWSDRIRQENYGVFCNEAMRTVSKPIVIVSDVRRPNDIRWFLEHYSRETVKITRIQCPDSVRAERGWEFESGVDDVQSECGLDVHEDWDFVLQNDGSIDSETLIKPLLHFIKSIL